MNKEYKRTLIKEIVIRKLKSAGEEILVQKEYTYSNAFIDNTEIIGGKELAIIFSFDKLKVVDSVFGEGGHKSGIVAYEVEVFSGKVSA